MEPCLGQRTAETITEFVMDRPSFYIYAGFVGLLALHFFVGQKIAAAVLDKMGACFKKIKADLTGGTFPA